MHCLLRSHVVAARGSSPLMLSLWRPTRVPDHLFYTETSFSDAWSRCFTGRSIVCPLTPRRLVRRPGFEDFPCRRNRAMCVLIASGALSSGDQKEHTNTESNHATEPAETSLSGRSVNRPGTLATNLNQKDRCCDGEVRGQGWARTPRLSRAKSAGGNLVCRYCGSDDLAPSFKKRRDARCHACFKKRYGAKKTGPRTAGTNRKAKAAK